MEPFSIIGIIIIAILVLSLGRIFSVLVKVIFYVLLVALVLVAVFGISYTELLNWATNIILWAF